MTNDLVELACDTSMRAAAQYLLRHNLDSDNDTLVQCLRAWVKIQLPVALKDAKQALDANMPQVAEQTFLATMMLAGIEAAKEAVRRTRNKEMR